MKITRQELIEFIIDSVSEDEMEVAEQLICETIEKWFQNSETIDLKMSEFYDWICDVADKLEANSFFVCDICGRMMTENDGEVVTAVEESDTKVLNFDGETKEFKLVPAIKEKTYCICPTCGNKIIRKYRTLNTL